MAARKLSGQSRNRSRCSSVDRSMENIPEEDDEKPFKHFINKQEVVAEDETELDENSSDSDEKNDTLGIERKISRESQQNGNLSRGDSRRISDYNIDSKLPSRKPSAANSASSSNCPSRRWSRHSSPTRGEILRMDDEMHTVNRGGKEMTIPLNITHHIPPKTIGLLDEEGILICDRMLNSGYTVQEIVEYFKTYVPVKDRIAQKFKEYKELTEKLKNGDVSASEKMRMLKDIMAGQNLSEKDFLDLMKTQFGDKTREEMEEMLKSGMSMEEVLEHFQRQAEKEELKNKLQDLLNDQNSNPEEVFKALRDSLGDADNAKIDEMLKRGMTMEEIIKHFMEGRMDGNCDLPTTEEIKQKRRDDIKDKIKNLINDPNASTEDVFNALKNSLSKEEQEKMNEMLKLGMSMEDVIKHFMEGGMADDKADKQKEREELKCKLKDLLNDPKAKPEDVFKAMMESLSKEDKAKVQEMLKKGMSKADIIKLFMSGGLDDKDAVQKAKDELKLKLHNLLEDPNAKTEDIFNTLRSQLGVDDQAKIDAMLAKGMSMEQIINHFMKGGMDEVVEESAFAKKMKEMVGGKNLTEKQMLDLMKSQLGEGSKAQLEEMLKSGMSLADAMKHFMEHGKTEEQEQAEKAAQIKAAMENPNMTSEEKMKFLKENLSDEAKAAMDKLLAQGYSMDEVMNLMKEHGNNVEGLTAAAEAQRTEKLKAALDDPNMSAEEKMQLLKENLSDEAKAAMDKLLAQGYSMDEVMNLMKNCGNNVEGLEAAAEAQRAEMLKAALDDPNMSTEDKMKLLKDNLSDEAKAAMDKLLAEGYTMDEVMNLMKTHGNDIEGLTAATTENEFKKKMKELAGGKDLTEDQMLELMKSQLGAGSRAELEAMLAKGVSLQDAMSYMMRNGKTEEQEQALLAEKIRCGMEGKNMTDREKIDFLREHLSDEAKAAMDDLLAQGYSMEEVIELFTKFGNNLNAIDQELSCPNVSFEDEPEDAHLYADRNVFTMIDQNTVKEEVPYMSPSTRNLTFKQFIDKVRKLVHGKGLTHREVLDIMEFRLGGLYLQEMKDLRASGATLAEIVEHFMKKDAEMRQQARRKARLEAQAKVDAYVDLKRPFIKNLWGVQISYTFSDEFGLHLVIGQVEEGCAAYQCGIREGDIIVYVNGWLITVMDKPQVAVNLFQAGANIVTLGILKASDKPHDIIAFAQGQTPFGNLVGAY